MSTRTLGSWTIGDKLGEGSAGEVYRARRADGVKGALKLYHNREPAFVSGSLAALQRLAGVSHPNLTAVLDVGVQGDTLFSVSRLIEGRTLEDLLQQGPLSREDAITLVAAVGAALDALHRAGLVHRDIKPTNVIVPAPGGPAAAVLVDLGLAGVVDQSTRLTRAGEVFGTPEYMSPEQALGLPQSAASDVWGLAALYYRLRFGRPPFAGESALAILAAVVTEKLRFPTGGVIDDADVQALMRALDRDPKQRFPTARAFVEALRVPEGVRPPGAAGVAAPAAAAPGPPPLPSPAAAAPATPASITPQPLPAAPRAGLPPGLLLGGLAAVVLAIGVVIAQSRSALTWTVAVLVGLAAATGAWVLLARLAARSQLQRRHFSGRLQTMRKPGRRQLTDSLALSMDELLKANRDDPHMKMMGASIRLVIAEYKGARARDDRRQALEQIVKLIELLDQRSSRTSWLERHQKLLAIATGALALLGTGATQLSGYVLAPVRVDGCPDRPMAGGERQLLSSLLRGDPALADKVWWSVDGVEKKQGGTFTFQVPRPPDRDSYVIKLTAPGAGSASCVVRARR